MDVPHSSVPHSSTYGLEEDNSFSTQLGRLIGESLAKAPYGSFTGLNLLSGSKR